MLPLSFYRRETVSVAKKLLGCYLVYGDKVGKIIETEAYVTNDPACHTFNGKTKRNAAMFENGGIAYVYFIYGMHHCFNVVTSKKGIGEAVLIRALEPIKNIENCKGPAKLVKAMGLQNANFQSLKSDLHILKGEPVRIESSQRIGISKGKEFEYRFYVKS